MGLKSRNKGKAFERKIARALRDLWPDALVRRSSQAERAYNADVFVEGGPKLLSQLWLEMHDARKPVALNKLIQAERDVRGLVVTDRASCVPVVIWHKLGEQSIQATMRSWAFAWLAYGESFPESQFVVTMDFRSFLRMVESAIVRGS